MSDQVPPRWRFVVASVSARLAEVALAAIGIVYVFGSDQPRFKVQVLAWWDVIVVVYLLVGFWVVRRGRDRDTPPARPTPGWQFDLRRRFSFLLTVIASLTGLAAASDVLVHGVSHERDPAVKTLGVIAVIAAWMLLHVGYAEFYRNLDGARRAGGGRELRFQEDVVPTTVDYMYFAITLGVAFTASDVEVVGRRARWHVLVHEILSFFYNAIVLAIAFSVITGY